MNLNNYHSTVTLKLLPQTLIITISVYISNGNNFPTFEWHTLGSV